MRWVALVVCCMMLVPSVAAAPYLQHQVDAQRTGNSPDPGPEYPDVMARLHLPGARGPHAQPVIIGESIYVLMVEGPDRGLIDLGPATAGMRGADPKIYRIDLATARWSVWHELPELSYAWSLASDGERLFVAGQPGMVAIDLEDASIAWQTPLSMPPVADPTFESLCLPPAVDPDRHEIAVTCYQDSSQASDRAYTKTWLLALDGQEKWATVAGANEYEPTGRPDDLALSENFVITAKTSTYWAGASSESGAIIEYYDRATGAYLGVVTAFGYALTGTSGTVLGRSAPSAEQAAAIALHLSESMRATLAVGGDFVILRGFGIHKLPITDDGINDSSDDPPAETLWLDASATGTSDSFCCTDAPPVLAGEELFAPHIGAMFKASISPFQQTAAAALTAGDGDGVGSTLLANGRLYFTPFAISPKVLVMDADTLEEESTIGRAATGSNFRVYDYSGIGEGIFAVVSGGGEVMILGQTAASPAIDVHSASPYPTPGSEWTIDLSNSFAGALGDELEYRITWGDGDVSYWSADPVRTHTFDAPGIVEVVIRARNDAGQETTKVMALDVGGQPPSFLAERFSPENQETTFFILGLLITLAFAAVGATRIGRRRRTLRREVERLESEVEAARNEPAVAERRIADAKDRARVLTLAGRLDESQAALLRDRADELLRQERTGTLTADLGFLPVSIADTVREMLADGRIQSWERDHILDVVDRDKRLTPAYRKKVRGLVEEWARRDAGT